MDNRKVEVSVTETGLTVSVPLKTKSLKRQAMIKRMVTQGDIPTLMAYASSFTGERARHIYLDRIKAHGPNDMLARKKPDSVLVMFDRMLETTRSHAPASKHTTWLGVEIECFVPHESLQVHVTEEECDACEGVGTVEDRHGNEMECDACEGTGQREVYQGTSNARRVLAQKFKDAKITNVTLKDDGSLRPDPGYMGIEVTVLTRLESSENLRRACDLLNELGARVNKSCGLHVHIDARHLDGREVKKRGQNFKKAMPILAGMVPASRRSNQYCRLEVSPLKGHQRYFAVNLTAFRKFKTVEIRLHSATTSYQKIIEWSRLITGIFNAEKMRAVSTLNELTEYVKIPESTLEYCTQRMALFSPAQSACDDQYLDLDSTDPVEVPERSAIDILRERAEEPEHMRLRAQAIQAANEQASRRIVEYTPNPWGSAYPSIAYDIAPVTQADDEAV